MRPALLATALVLLLALALPLLVLRNESWSITTLQWAVARFTEYRLVLAEPSLDVYAGTLSAAQLHLYPDGDGGQALVSVLALDADTSVTEILTGSLGESRIEAGSVTIFVTEDGDSAEPEPVQWLGYLSWLPRQLAVGSVHLITQRWETYIFPLAELRGERVQSNRFRATSGAQYEGEPLQLRLELGIAREADDSVVFDMATEAYAPRSDSRVSLQGELQGTREAFNYNAALQADYRDIGEFLDGFDGAPDLNGHLTIAGRLLGNADGFILQDARLRLDNLPHYGIEAAGTIAQQLGGRNAIQLSAAGEIGALGTLVDWTGFDLSRFGRAQGNMDIVGSFNAPHVRNMVLMSDSDRGLRAIISGDVRLGETAFGADNLIRIDVSAPSLAALDLLEEAPPVDPGYWRSSAVLSGNRDAVAVSEFLLQAGTVDSLQLHMRGSIDDVTDVGTEGVEALRGLRASVSAQVDDISSLADIGGPELPAFQSYHSELSVVGDGPLLQVTGGSARIHSSDMQAELTGLRGNIHLLQAPFIRDAGAAVRLDLSDTSALSLYSPQAVPALGPVRGDARMVQEQDRFALRDIHLQLQGEDDMRVDARGSIADLLQQDGLALQVDFEGIDTRQLLATALESYSYPDPVGQLAGSLGFRYEEGRWRVERLEARNLGKDDLELSIRGSLQDRDGRPAVSLNAGVNISDREFLHAVSGLRLMPVNGSLRSGSTDSGVDLSLKAAVGSTRVLGNIDLGLEAGAVSALQAHLRSDQLLLADFGLQAMETDAAEQPTAPDPKDDSGPTPLQNLLQQAPRYPTDLRLDLNNIVGDNSRIESLNLHVTGRDGQHTLRQLSARYADAQAEVRGIVDLNQSQPWVSLAGEAVELPMTPLFEDLGIDFDIQGTLTVRGGLTAQGVDRDTLIASTNGSLAFALQDAVIKGAAYDVLATSLLEWLFAGGAMQESTRFDCTMAGFTVRQGVASSDTLFVETRRMVATGEAELNFPRNRIDLVLTPLSKSRSLQIPSSIKIRGDLDDPRVVASPVAAVADATAEALTLIPRIIGKMFLRGDRGRERQPCVANPGN